MQSLMINSTSRVLLVPALADHLILRTLVSGCKLLKTFFGYYSNDTNPRCCPLDQGLPWATCGRRRYQNCPAYWVSAQDSFKRRRSPFWVAKDTDADDHMHRNCFRWREAPGNNTTPVSILDEVQSAQSLILGVFLELTHSFVTTCTFLIESLELQTGNPKLRWNEIKIKIALMERQTDLSRTLPLVESHWIAQPACFMVKCWVWSVRGAPCRTMAFCVQVLSHHSCRPWAHLQTSNHSRKSIECCTIGSFSLNRRAKDKLYQTTAIRALANLPSWKSPKLQLWFGWRKVRCDLASASSAGILQLQPAVGTRLACSLGFVVSSVQSKKALWTNDNNKTF